ncbi:MAG: transposase [Rhodobacteraceae bacterium]|nr:transposase [Paracoccaceae bacterium]
MKRSTRFSPKIVERAVRTVFEAKDQYDSQWAAIVSIAGKIGCTSETLRRWARQHEHNTGRPRHVPATAAPAEN